MTAWRRNLLGAACIFIIGSLIVWALGGADCQARVERRFHADREELTQTAEQVLAGQTVEPPAGWLGVSRFDDVVCFDCGGWGLGPSTRYCGVNYVADDQLVGFQGTSVEGAVPEGDGWLWKQDEGDNCCYVERLAPCWYYFEAKF